MTEVEFSRLLSDLSDAAQKLNRESDSLNETITACEAMLLELNPGLEVWLDHDPLESVAWIESGGEGLERGTEATELGLTELYGKWGLVLREVRYETRDAHTNSTTHPRLYEVLGTKRLLDASRKERIEALKRLPQLVAAMKDGADAALKAIEAAKKLVK